MLLSASLGGQNHSKMEPTGVGANACLQLLLENSKTKKGHNYVKKIMRVTCPTGMVFPFDGKQLV